VPAIAELRYSGAAKQTRWLSGQRGALMTVIHLVVVAAAFATKLLATGFGTVIAVVVKGFAFVEEGVALSFELIAHRF
jgi:hypothetical protein